MTSLRACAGAARARSVSDAMGVRRVTGAFPAADPASATDTRIAATRELESVSTAGTTLEETSVTGDVAAQLYFKPNLNSAPCVHLGSTRHRLT